MGCCRSANVQELKMIDKSTLQKPNSKTPIFASKIDDIKTNQKVLTNVTALPNTKSEISSHISENNEKIKSQILEPISLAGTQNMGIGFCIDPFKTPSLQASRKVLVESQKHQLLFGTPKSDVKPYIKSSQNQNKEGNGYVPAVFKELPLEINQFIEQLGIYEPEYCIIYEGVKYEFQKFSDGQIYEGQMYGDTKHGYGYHFTGRSFYEGYFENDQRTGCGREVFQNGDFKIGNWKENKIEGYGILKQKDNQYFGEWVKDQPNGLGILENKNFKYEGDFQSGKLHGYGQKLNFLDSSKYIGQFQENRMHGQGILIFKDKVYKGLFFNNKFEGQGEMLYSDGSKYEGMYKNNFRDGKGKMIMADGSIKLDGEWFQDEFKQ